MGRLQTKAVPMRFKTMVQPNVPQGRHGERKEIVIAILRNFDNVKVDSAIKVPLAELFESNRATRKAKRRVETASDANFLYIWNVRE